YLRVQRKRLCTYKHTKIKNPDDMTGVLLLLLENFFVFVTCQYKVDMLCDIFDMVSDTFKVLGCKLALPCHEYICFLDDIRCRYLDEQCIDVFIAFDDLGAQVRISCCICCFSIFKHKQCKPLHRRQSEQQFFPAQP